jgi:uncharacterized membrane protein HdeD (DUF308 family)
VLFGIAALFWPGLTLVTLVYLFSAFVLVWGVAEIAGGLLSIGTRSNWWLSLIFGMTGLGVGVYLVRHPHVTFATLILLIGFTLIVRGLIDIVSALIDEGSATFKVLNIIVGVVAIAIGIFVLNSSVSAGVAFVWLLGLYALIMGPLMIALSFDLKHTLEASNDK